MYFYLILKHHKHLTSNVNIFLSSKYKILKFLFDLSLHCTDKSPQEQDYGSQTSV